MVLFWMWLIIIVFLQLTAKEGFPVIRVICHESVIYVTGHVSHRSEAQDLLPIACILSRSIYHMMQISSGVTF